MPWTLPKPWENGFVPVTEPTLGGPKTGKVPLQRVWKKEETPPVPDPAPNP